MDQGDVQSRVEFQAPAGSNIGGTLIVNYKLTARANPLESSRSPVGVRVPLPVYECLHPEGTVDVFIIKQSGAFVEFARYHSAGWRVGDAIEMVHGELVGWELDRNYVEQCVATAISTAPKGALFDINIYTPK